MSLHAKNGTVTIENTDMDYITFGTGSNYLVMLPGLGDGLTTVKGTALAFSVAYSAYAKNHKVYVFSRKNRLEENASTRSMAKDLVAAMKVLGITKADVIGISQGGMIAQYAAIDYPDMVHKLVLAVTSSKPNETLCRTVNSWIEMAKAQNYKSLIIDTAEKSYSEKYLKKYRLLYPLLGILGKPKDFRRFLIHANSCLLHNACEELEKITCPVLVIGGGCDKIVGSDSSYEIAQQIPDSKLFVYDNLGHAAYEEAKDFSRRVLDFLLI